MELGGHGEISVTANIMPKAVAQMCESVLQGNLEQAREIDASLAELHQVLFVESNPIPAKWALEQMGRVQGGIRLPMTRLSEMFQTKVREALIRAGAL
jgi:dihydrodipicolinate synthase/N-acetylneuraminate lyase